MNTLLLLLVLAVMGEGDEPAAAISVVWDKRPSSSTLTSFRLSHFGLSVVRLSVSFPLLFSPVSFRPSDIVLVHLLYCLLAPSSSPIVIAIFTKRTDIFHSSTAYTLSLSNYPLKHALVYTYFLFGSLSRCSFVSSRKHPTYPTCTLCSRTQKCIFCFSLLHTYIHIYCTSHLKRHRHMSSKKMILCSTTCRSIFF